MHIWVCVFAVMFMCGGVVIAVIALAGVPAAAVLCADDVGCRGHSGHEL